MLFLDEIAAVPNCRGIQWNPVVDYGFPTRHVEPLREIRRRGLALYLTCETVEEACAITRELGPQRLFIRLSRVFDSPDQAEEAIARIARACG